MYRCNNCGFEFDEPKPFDEHEEVWGHNMAITVFGCPECQGSYERIEEPGYYYFTFGLGHPEADTVQAYWGTYEEARDKMFEHYGSHWCTQYSQPEFNRLQQKRIDSDKKPYEVRGLERGKR